jgi:hypothetical protein
MTTVFHWYIAVAMSRFVFHELLKTFFPFCVAFLHLLQCAAKNRFTASITRLVVYGVIEFEFEFESLIVYVALFAIASSQAVFIDRAYLTSNK